MDSNGLLDRDGARGLLNADEGRPELPIKGGRRTSVPSDRGGGVKLAQAVVSRTKDGRWKITSQSYKQVENMFVGSFEDIVQTLREYSRSDWEQRS